jgi:ABC transport system ATP-binding/permease protein
VLLISHDRDFVDRVAHAVIVPEGGGRWTEYAGGYTDMLAQRGAGPGALRVPKERAGVADRAPKARAAPTPAPSKRRLSFHEKHALKTLPGEIARLEEAARAMQERLEDPDLYARDPKAFADTSSKLAAALADLSAAEERWLELELLRAEAEGG